ncbi:unnamed protein product [Schistosoma margrebowiei]|uniref:Uncharacterized protein n=1 Tax=Schistosoma margrebowiei TaxID=48269 RepID=A0A183M834_9TREM|nr:unnamed protein product [Schistosoma margrebowiei]
MNSLQVKTKSSIKSKDDNFSGKSDKEQISQNLIDLEINKHPTTSESIDLNEFFASENKIINQVKRHEIMNKAI